MWTHKLLLVLVLISVSQANPLHQKILATVNEDSEGRYVLDDVDEFPSGPQIAIIRVKDATEKPVHKEVPSEPKISIIRVKDATEKPVHKESVKPVLECSPVSIMINIDRSKANDEDRSAHGPAGQPKQRQYIEIHLNARDIASETFAKGDDSRPALIPGEPVRTSEHVSAGLQSIGFPTGPQLTMSSKD